MCYYSNSNGLTRIRILILIRNTSFFPYVTVLFYWRWGVLLKSPWLRYRYVLKISILEIFIDYLWRIKYWILWSSLGIVVRIHVYHITIWGPILLEVTYFEFSNSQLNLAKRICQRPFVYFILFFSVSVPSVNSML